MAANNGVWLEFTHAARLWRSLSLTVQKKEEISMESPSMEDSH